MYYYM